MGPACASHRVGQHESRAPLAGLECGVAKGSRGVETPDDEGEGIDVVGKAAIPWAGLVGAESKMNVGDAPSLPACASRAEDIASFDRLPLPDVDLRKMAIERPPQRGLPGPVLDAYTVTTAPLKTSLDDDPVGRSDHRIPYEDSEIDARVTSRRSAAALQETVVRQDAGRALWRAPEKHDRVEQRECRQRIPEELDPEFAIWTHGLAPCVIPAFSIMSGAAPAARCARESAAIGGRSSSFRRRLQVVDFRAGVQRAVDIVARRPR